ncbi:NAD(P)-dependent oxidoreductase [Salinirubrum litoreum]|uniref:NAD(P)-dependent oxidoreductase n=1 Tax=Salinirubrum litoreum TaxID=1126234 RepID=A0ABD5REP1_9EURY|nr:NAD(P)H-binding protein [Salinirubrum litoreum]
MTADESASRRIAVFGASGRTGLPLVERALDHGHTVVAFVRDAERLPLSPADYDDRLVVIEGDAYTGEGVSAAVAGADAVVSTLGQTDGSPDDLLTVAGDHVLDAMADHEVDRFVTLVGAGVREDGESVSMTGRVMGGLLKLVAREVLADAAEHVARVKQSDTRWTVVRAPRLVDGEGAGDYAAGDVSLGFEAVARADVARFLLDCVEDDLYVHDAPKVGPA